MKPVAREWIAKAEADFLSAQREFRARKHPNYDAACFFAQQCVEKYLKGRMADAGMVVPRTHDLAAPLDALLPLEPLWEAARPRLETLSFGAPKPATHRRPKPATMWGVLGGRIVLFGSVGKGRDQVVAA